MNATCPKCGRLLRAWDWRQECPDCGVNLIGYEMNRRLKEDADKAELEFAMLQPYIDRAKASYVGSKAAIVRMVVHILPILSLLLPLVRIRGTGYGIVGIVKELIAWAQTLDLSRLPDMLHDTLYRSGLLALVFTVLSVLMIFVHLGFLSGSCSEKGKRRILRMDAVMCICAAAAFVFALLFCKSASGAVHLGAVVFLVSYQLLTVYDIVLMRVGIPVTYKPCFVDGIPLEEYLYIQETTA